jgi:hypothetical protein
VNEVHPVSVAAPEAQPPATIAAAARAAHARVPGEGMPDGEGKRRAGQRRRTRLSQRRHSGGCPPETPTPAASRRAVSRRRRGRSVVCPRGRWGATRDIASTPPSRLSRLSRQFLGRRPPLRRRLTGRTRTS